MNEITYAHDKENKLVYIDSVPNGELCNCFCPSCHSPMIAKNKGNIRIHHFAHATNCECSSGYQTMIHLLAKEIIAELKWLPLTQNGKNLLRATEVYLEQRIDDIIPDILGFVPITVAQNQVVGMLPVIAEIYVTHKVDEEKEKKIKNLGIPAVEVDLSKSQALTKEELMNEIYNPKNWRLVNSSINQKYLPKVQVDISSLLYQYRALMGNSNSYSHNRQHYYGYRRNYRRRR